MSRLSNLPPGCTDAAIERDATAGDERTWAVLCGDDVYEFYATEADARAAVAALNEYRARPMTKAERKKFGVRP